MGFSVPAAAVVSPCESVFLPTLLDHSWNLVEPVLATGCADERYGR